MSNKYYLYSSTINADIRIDNHSKKLKMKAIVVESGLLESHLEFLRQQITLNGVSKSWISKNIQSIRLLLDYSIANEGAFDNPKDMFEMFSNRLNEGTLDDNGYDPTGLYWKPFSENNSNRIINHITSFSDWLYEHTGGESKLLNPINEATKAQRVLNLAAFNHRANNSFLKHTYTNQGNAQSIASSRNVKKKSYVPPDYDPSKAFPDDRIWDLLTVGFSRKGVPSSVPLDERANLGNILITMLLHFGGLRESEPFHIYKDDIIPNAGYEQIRVYHPFKGNAPTWYRNKTHNHSATRQEFLLDKYGLAPRWKHSNSTYAAGWKKPITNNVGHYMDVFLFGSPDITEIFMTLFRAYLKVRVSPLVGREHPFLFTNINGDPLSMDSFKAAHKAAILKIGMTPLLDFGGTCHSHRHAYGTRLKEAGVSELSIKKCMHHASIDSQKIYQHKHRENMQLELKEGMSRLNCVPSSLISAQE